MLWRLEMAALRFLAASTFEHALLHIASMTLVSCVAPICSDEARTKARLSVSRSVLVFISMQKMNGEKSLDNIDLVAP